MVNPLRYLTDSPHIYEQALSDFGITELMEKLSNFSDSDRNASWMNLETSELESLATILIRGLTLSLKGKLIASYVNTQVASYPRIALQVTCRQYTTAANSLGVGSVAWLRSPRPI